MLKKPGENKYELYQPHELYNKTYSNSNEYSPKQNQIGNRTRKGQICNDNGTRNAILILKMISERVKK